MKRHRVGKSKKRHTLAKVPRSFKSDEGRTFAVGPGKHEESYPNDPSWWDEFPVLLDGKQVGWIRQDDYYSVKRDGKRDANSRWRGGVGQLMWAGGGEVPTGLGFDIGPCDTPEEALHKLGRSADEVLDWREGKRTPELEAQARPYRGAR